MVRKVTSRPFQDEKHLLGAIFELPRLIFDYPTIASVASYASEQLGSAPGMAPVAGRSTSQSSPVRMVFGMLWKGCSMVLVAIYTYVISYHIVSSHIISYYCDNTIETGPLSPFCRRTHPRWPAGSAAVGGWHGRQLPGRRLKVQLLPLRHHPGADPQ